MKELMRTNDPVLITYVQALLADEEIECVVMDLHVSVLEGSIGAIPRRIMVLDDDLLDAKETIQSADGLENWFD